MHPQQIKLEPIITRPSQPPQTYLQATRAEIAVLQAALQYYCDYIRCNQELIQAIPLLQSFVLRLHDQLPAPEALPASSLIYIQASHAEIIILQAALRHYRDYVSYEKELVRAIPLIQSFIQRLHGQLPPREEL